MIVPVGPIVTLTCPSRVVPTVPGVSVEEEATGSEVVVELGVTVSETEWFGVLEDSRVVSVVGRGVAVPL